MTIQLVAGNRQRQVLEIMLTGTANFDETFSHFLQIPLM